MISNGGGLRWWLPVPVCIILLVYFIAEAVMFDKPPPDSPEPLNPSWYKIETARGEIRENQSIVGNCFLCHAYWVPIPTSRKTSSPRFAHSNISLNHGNNDNCYNCHNIIDRNKYAANDGTAIITRRPELLCSRCHGLVYEDWKAGTHGKWTGRLSTAGGGKKKTYTCTECHDPHDPAYRYNVVAPAPIWDQKYIRTPLDHSDENELSGFLIDEEPKEIF